MTDQEKKKLSFFELNLKYKNKINIDYNDIDFQKGENSPRHLFKKRRTENNDNSYSYIYTSSTINKESNYNTTSNCVYPQTTNVINSNEERSIIYS